MSKKHGTYLVSFSDGYTIVCGNNYKSWLTHAAEYSWSKHQENRPHEFMSVTVKFSDTPFTDDGGLKWATPKGYQDVIDEVSAKDGKKRTDFKDIVFERSEADTKKLEKELKYRGII
jgi:hypothetical protein